MEHKKYCMIYETDCTADGVEFDDFESAKAEAIEIYTSWVCEEIADWTFNDTGKPLPTEKQIEDWDYMYDNCSCYVVEWDEEKQEYEDIDDAYFIPDEELREIGWMEWSEIVKKMEGEAK